MIRAILLTVAGAALLTACGEDPQVANRTGQDTASFQGTGKQPPYMASGWKAGDKTSWEQQLKTRTQMGQNDYVKVN